MEETKKKWGAAIDKHPNAVLLGANINVGKYDEDDWYGYICIYVLFWTISIGYEYF